METTVLHEEKFRRTVWFLPVLYLVWQKGMGDYSGISIRGAGLPADSLQTAPSCREAQALFAKFCIFWLASPTGFEPVLPP
jgi:hypothetical protein